MQSERFKQLAKQFLVRTSDELAQLRAHLPQAQAGDEQALLAMQHASHRIHGSGAMLGFKEVSDQAAQIENILRRTGNAPGPGDWSDIVHYIDELSAALQVASIGDPPDYG